MAINIDARFDRSDADNRTAREIPEEVVNQIIQDAEQTSAVLKLANVRRMAAYQTRYRLLDSFPEAYWINGTAATDKPSSVSAADGTQAAKDSSLKQTTSFSWTNAYLTPDEIAVMAVMPDGWRDDSDVAWEEIRTALRTAFAKKIDNAVLYGRGGVPANFGNGVVFDAVAAGNIVTEPNTYPGANGAVDLADAYALLFQELAERGYEPNGAQVGAGEVWRLRRLRDGNSQPVYQDLSGQNRSELYGKQLEPVTNGVWDRDAAVALAGDFSQLHVGIRQDMTFALSNTAVIHDLDGTVAYNAWQQDGEVIRVVMRLGYVVTDPLKHLTGAREFPFTVLREENSASA